MKLFELGLDMLVGVHSRRSNDRVSQGGIPASATVALPRPLCVKIERKMTDAHMRKGKGVTFA